MLRGLLLRIPRVDVLFTMVICCSAVIVEFVVNAKDAGSKYEELSYNRTIASCYGVVIADG